MSINLIKHTIKNKNKLMNISFSIYSNITR
jgi:hypothetical protein